MLDEKARRRAETFDEENSVPITLADGQDWYFSKPWLQVHASFDGGRAGTTYPVLTYGPELDTLIDAVSECDDAPAVLIGAASLGAYLLRQNYDLTDPELDTLFCFRLADPGSWDWARAVMGVATGTSGPKRGCAGGG